VESLHGRYITAEDVNTSVHDMEYIFMETKYVTGVAPAHGGSGDPSPVTAYGVLRGMQASAKAAFGDESLSGRRVAVQGLGNVGSHLVEHLAKAGAKVTVTDLDQEKCRSMEDSFGVEVVAPEKIYDAAGAPYHLIGLTHLPYLEKLGGALAGMGFRKTALVQGMEGNEDLPTSRAVRVIEFVSEGEGSATKTESRLNAADDGLTPATAEHLAPGTGADRSAQLTLQVLRGEASAAWRDLVLFNAGFRVYLAGRAADTAAGIELAQIGTLAAIYPAT
jgi:hypothetical protein